MASPRFTLRAAAGVAIGAVVLLAGAACGGSGGSQASSTSNSTAASAPTSASRQRLLAEDYVAIANLGNRRLDHDFDPLEDRDANNLTRARADLADAAATERLFDRRLLTIRFPAATASLARELYRINQERATLTVAAAAATSLAALHSYEPVLDAANVPVEDVVKAIRRRLDLPPPESS
jgi:hypothetical protein